MKVVKLYDRVTGHKPKRLVLLALEISQATLGTISRFKVPIDVIAGKILARDPPDEEET